mgnify:CR=1 FL=1
MLQQRLMVRNNYWFQNYVKYYLFPIYKNNQTCSPFQFILDPTSNSFSETGSKSQRKKSEKNIRKIIKLFVVK